MGAKAECKPHAVQVPVTINGVRIEPGDFIFADGEGVVCIPKRLGYDVVTWLKQKRFAGDAEDKIKAMVERGHTVQEAFDRYRRE